MPSHCCVALPACLPRSEEEVRHWLAMRPEVVYSYVVESAAGEVTDLLSFYTLPSTGAPACTAQRGCACVVRVCLFLHPPLHRCACLQWECVVHACMCVRVRLCARVRMCVSVGACVCVFV